MSNDRSAVVNEWPIGIIVLAAGASARMDQPKQLLRHAGETLLRRAVNSALATGCRPVIVVLGAQADALCNEVADTDAHIAVNPEWADGMSSSIRCGLAALEALTVGRTRAAVVTLCDQPRVTTRIINRLLETFDGTCPPLVASEYESNGEKTRGAPVLFSRALFPELMGLRGTEGAKRIVERHLSEASLIRVPEAAFDVDTPLDYRALQRKAYDRTGDSQPKGAAI
jgi:molybdenum cofactor cytidylyltransferase